MLPLRAELGTVRTRPMSRDQARLPQQVRVPRLAQTHGLRKNGRRFIHPEAAYGFEGLGDRTFLAE